MAMSEKRTENAIITGTEISMEDHGCLTFYVHLEGRGWECGFGGYCIGHGYLDADEFTATDSGLVAMMKIMDTVGVERWENLKGKYCRVMTDGWGGTVDVIGNIIKDKWFNIREFFAITKGEVKE